MNKNHDLAISKILAGRDYMLSYGWRRGIAAGYAKPACMIFAIVYADDNVLDAASVNARSCAYIALDGVLDMLAIDWNDRVCESQDQAIEALMSAASLLMSNACDNDPVNHRLYNSARRRTCGASCKICNP